MTRRGDLLVIEFSRSVAFTQGGDRLTTTDYDLHQVTNITRAGVAKATRDRWPGATPTPLARWTGVTNTLVIPAVEFDVEAIWAAALRHTWPDHPNQPRNWATLEELRVLCAPHRRPT